jgi:hypothetical protein
LIHVRRTPCITQYHSKKQAGFQGKVPALYFGLTGSVLMRLNAAGTHFQQENPSKTGANRNKRFL